jgi:hypothetical protein
MALKSFFILYPGLPAPQHFKPGHAPLLLAQQDLWAEVRQCGPSLLFRVRSEQKGNEGDRLQVGDTLESCVGLVDSSTRWRAAFRMAGVLIGAVRHAPLAQACTNALQFAATSHPASVSAAQRHAVAMDLFRVADTEATDTQPAAMPYERVITKGLADLVQADNDYDAAYMTPFEAALCPFSEDGQEAQFAARMGSLETYTGAVLLDQAFARLAERMPAWLFVKMPTLTLAGTEAEET